MRIYVCNECLGFPRGSAVKNLQANAGDRVRSLGWEDPLEKEMQRTPVLLPGKFDGQRSLMGYSPWGCKRAGHDLAIEQQ